MSANATLQPANQLSLYRLSAKGPAMFTFSIYRVFRRYIHIGMTLLIFPDLVEQSVSVATGASFSSLMSAIDT